MQDAVAVSLAQHGYPLTRFQLLEISEHAVSVPWLLPSDSFRVAEEAEGELAFYAGGEGGQALTSKLKRHRPKRHPNFASWINFWTYHSGRVMAVSDTDRILEVRSALNDFQGLVCQMMRTNGWTAVSLFILAAMAVWQHGGVLVMTEVKALWELAECGYLGKVEDLPDPYSGMATAWATPDRGVHNGGGVRPAFKKTASCSKCKSKGYTFAWCPLCKPTLPGALSALQLMDPTQRSGGRATNE